MDFIAGTLLAAATIATGVANNSAPAPQSSPPPATAAARAADYPGEKDAVEQIIEQKQIQDSVKPAPPPTPRNYSPVDGWRKAERTWEHITDDSLGAVFVNSAYTQGDDSGRNVSTLVRTELKQSINGYNRMEVLVRVDCVNRSFVPSRVSLKKVFATAEIGGSSEPVPAVRKQIKRGSTMDKVRERACAMGKTTSN